MIKYSKYKPLADYLSKTGNDKITLTFSEIENILGFKLPKSARKHRAIWANDRSHSLSKGWLPVQYRSYSPDMKDEIVNFKKDNSLNPNTNGEQISKSNKSKIIKPHSTNVIVLTNELIEEGHRQVKATNNYGNEDDLITDCFKKFPLNNDVDVVAMKIGIIDITNSTHISQHKSKINAVELAECIVNIKNIDERIKNGDPEVVNEIAKSNGKINLMSFASKYCCYHNKNLYGKDDYSILDTVVKKFLPKYFDDITTCKIQKWQKEYNYKAYNDYITKKLNKFNINVPFRKRKLDHYVWFNNRKKTSK